MMLWDETMAPSVLEEGGPSTPKMKFSHIEFQKLHVFQSLLYLLMQLVS